MGRVAGVVLDMLAEVGGPGGGGRAAAGAVLHLSKAQPLTCFRPNTPAVTTLDCSTNNSTRSPMHCDSNLDQRQLDNIPTVSTRVREAHYPQPSRTARPLEITCTSPHGSPDDKLQLGCRSGLFSSSALAHDLLYVLANDLYVLRLCHGAIGP